METIYTVQYFVDKFSAIPESLWLVDIQGDGDDKSPHCAVGWCKNLDGKYGHSNQHNSEEVAALYLLFETAGIRSRHYKESAWNIAEVNNGDHPDYQQPTAKLRILAALKHIAALQNVTPPDNDILVQPIAPEPVKIIYKTVVIDSKVRDLVNAEMGKQ